MTEEMVEWIKTNIDPHGAYMIIKTMGFQQNSSADWFSAFAKQHREFGRWVFDGMKETPEGRRNKNCLVTSQDARKGNAAIAAFNIAFPEVKLRASCGVGEYTNITRRDLMCFLSKLGLSAGRLDQYGGKI